ERRGAATPGRHRLPAGLGAGRQRNRFPDAGQRELRPLHPSGRRYTRWHHPRDRSGEGRDARQLSRRRLTARVAALSARGGRGGMRDPRFLGAAGLLPDLVELVDQVEEFLGAVEVRRGLHLRPLADGGLERVLEFGKLGVVFLGLVPVAPEDVEMVLGQLRAFLLDDDRALAVDLVLRVVVFLDDVVDGLCLDARLLRVVDPAGKIAMGLNRAAGANPLRQIHGANSSYTMNR